MFKGYAMGACYRHQAYLSAAQKVNQAIKQYAEKMKKAKSEREKQKCQDAIHDLIYLRRKYRARI